MKSSSESQAFQPAWLTLELVRRLPLPAPAPSRHKGGQGQYRPKHYLVRILEVQPIPHLLILNPNIKGEAGLSELAEVTGERLKCGLAAEANARTGDRIIC